MKKLIFAVILTFSAVLPSFAYSSECCGVYDTLTERFYECKNIDLRHEIASTTKIETAITVIENLPIDLETEVKDGWCGIEGSSMYLAPGEKVTVKELLYGLMLSSGNDAAVALSDLCPGLVSKMNAGARLLGCLDTCFLNPHGLPEDGHCSTVRDMAVMTAHALENPVFREIVSTKTVSFGGRTLKNHNRLLWELEGCIGVKTGYTKAAGRCLVSAVQAFGRRFVCVTFNGPDDWNDHKLLYDRVLGEYRAVTAVPSGVCGEAPVAGGKAVGLYINCDLGVCLHDGEEYETVLRGPRFSYAPINAGDFFGTLEICVGGKTVASEPVYYGETVSVPRRMNLIERLVSFFTR